MVSTDKNIIALQKQKHKKILYVDIFFKKLGVSYPKSLI